jgi:hypothetical protein
MSPSTAITGADMSALAILDAASLRAEGEAIHPAVKIVLLRRFTLRNDGRRRPFSRAAK